MGKPAQTQNNPPADVVISITDAVPAKNQLPVACVKFKKNKIQALGTLSIGFAIQGDKLLFTKTDRASGGLAIDMRCCMAQTGRPDIIRMLRHFQGAYALDTSQPGRCFIQVDPDSIKTLLQEQGPCGIPGAQLPPVEKYVEPVEPETKREPGPEPSPVIEPLAEPSAETRQDRSVTEDESCHAPGPETTTPDNMLLLRLLANRLMRQIHPGNAAARETAAVLLQVLDDIEKGAP